MADKEKILLNGMYIKVVENDSGCLGCIFDKMVDCSEVVSILASCDLKDCDGSNNIYVIG